MKNAIVILVAALVGFVAVGCANKNKQTADASVMDVTAPAPSGPSAYTPAPQPIAAQPVTYDTMPNNYSGNNAGTGSNNGLNSGSYTVKKATRSTASPQSLRRRQTVAAHHRRQPRPATGESQGRADDHSSLIDDSLACAYPSHSAIRHVAPGVGRRARRARLPLLVLSL